MPAIPLIPILTGLMLLAAVLIGYGLASHHLQWILPLMALVLLLRVWQTRQQRGLRYVFLSVTLAGAVLCVASLFHAHLWVLFYPVVVNLVMLVVFGARCGHPCR